MTRRRPGSTGAIATGPISRPGSAMNPSIRRRSTAHWARTPTNCRVARDSAAELILRQRSASDVRSVLDYGGDRGQFIPEELRRAQCLVYEISGLEPVSGVASITSPETLHARAYDVVMCCHVLEHVASPRALVADLRSLGDARTIFYVEVPLEHPCDEPEWGSAIACVSSALLRLPVLARCLQRTLGRPRFMMHEHVNAFTLESLRHLMEHSGLEILEARDCRITTGCGVARVGCCTCRKAGRENG